MGNLSGIKTYFRTRLDGLGYMEHLDGFGRDNIGETVLDKSYHVLVTGINGGEINQTHLETRSDVSVAVYYFSGRSASETIDDAIDGINNIIIDTVKIANRTEGGSGVLNVTFEGADINPVSDTNKNAVFVELRYRVWVMIGVEE